MNLSLKEFLCNLLLIQLNYLRANSSPGTSMSHLLRNALQKEINEAVQKKVLIRAFY